MHNYYNLNTDEDIDILEIQDDEKGVCFYKKRNKIYQL